LGGTPLMGEFRVNTDRGPIENVRATALRV